MGNKGRSKRREILLRLIVVIIRGQNMQKKLDGVYVTGRVGDGEGGWGVEVRGRAVLGTRPGPSPR